MRQYGLVMVRTTELVVTIVVFILAGNWIDKKFEANQKILITATIVGSILAFVRFVVSLQKLNKDNDQ